jgi:hypothetical protein
MLNIGTEILFEYSSVLKFFVIYFIIFLEIMITLKKNGEQKNAADKPPCFNLSSVEILTLCSLYKFRVSGFAADF